MIFLLVWFIACVFFFGITTLLDRDERVKRDDKEKSVRRRTERRDNENVKIEVDREKIIKCESNPEYLQYYKHR